MLNRKFIGIEKDEKYYNIAKKRIDDVKQIELVV
jgi:DNA modification methylase